jgi:hypothetical protein
MTAIVNNLNKERENPCNLLLSSELYGTRYVGENYLVPKEFAETQIMEDQAKIFNFKHEILEFIKVQLKTYPRFFSVWNVIAKCKKDGSLFSFDYDFSLDEDGIVCDIEFKGMEKIPEDQFDFVAQGFEITYP